MIILYGSETGTSQGFAEQTLLAFRRINPNVVAKCCMPFDEFRIQDLGNAKIAIFIVSTCGQGEMPTNMLNNWRYLLSRKLKAEWLSSLHYAVLALGDSSYQKYNFAGKKLFRRLLQLGAKPIIDLALADEQHTLGVDEVFEKWLPELLELVKNLSAFNLEENGEILRLQNNNLEADFMRCRVSDRQYRLEMIIGDATNNNDDDKSIFTGEFGQIGAYKGQRPPFEPKNPFLATIVVNRELHLATSDRSCRHIELSVDNALIRYETGDHIAIFPTNNTEMVNKLGTLLETELDTVFKLVNMDAESTKKHPFPCPCTFRTALTHYVDICSPVKSHVLKALVEFASDEETKAKLTQLSTAGLHEYAQFIVKERRCIVDVLQHFSACKPPLDLLLELLPRLQPRFYSISSSPRADASRVAVTAVVLRYHTNDGRMIKGVCTNFLADRVEDASTAPVFIRKSTLRLPHALQQPVIMIGPGTGFAPFRAFLHDRLWHKQRGEEEEVGEMHLFFGCRHPDHDHIYKEEMEEFVRIGLLTQLHVAYSRLHDEKVYVQHKLWDVRQHIWQLVHQAGASVYICGDARNMARDVQNMFYKIFVEVGGLTDQEAQKLMKDMERQRRYQADVWS